MQNIRILINKSYKSKKRKQYSYKITLMIQNGRKTMHTYRSNSTEMPLTGEGGGGDGGGGDGGGRGGGGLGGGGGGGPMVTVSLLLHTLPTSLVEMT